MKVYLGYTRTKARANLDQLWALLLLTECGGDAPALPPAVIPQRKYWGHGIPANCDVDAMWDALPGAIPADPDPDGKVFRAYASTIPYANLDALAAAIAPLTCCEPVEPPVSSCVKILDADFTQYADDAAFNADWPAVSGDPDQLHRVSPYWGTYLDAAVSPLGTRMTKKASEPDQTNDPIVPPHVFAFFSGVTPSARAPVWMRMRARLDTLNPTKTLNWGTQQLAFGGAKAAIALVDQSSWYSFAPDVALGGPFQSMIDCGVTTADGNLRLGGIGNPVNGFAWDGYYDGLATEWDMVAHMQFNDDGTARLRTFIGPKGGAVVPMSDVITYAPLMDHGELGWTYVSHKSDGGMLSAPMLVRAEAWECSYESNPCGVELVLPSAAPVITSLTPVDAEILLDDEIEIGYPLRVVAKDADGVAYPGILPLVLVDDLDDFSAWAQLVNSWTDGVTGNGHAVWPGVLNGGVGGTLEDGAGVVSAPVVLTAFNQVARRYWFIRADFRGSGLPLSIAGLELRESIGGPDISGLGTPIGSAPLAGTSLANAFDGSGATFFTATGPDNEQYIGIDFGVGVTKLIREVAITARTDRPDLAPAAFTICSSDDMTLIARHQPYTTQVWTSGQTLTFNVY